MTRVLFVGGEMETEPGVPEEAPGESGKEAPLREEDTVQCCSLKCSQIPPKSSQ